MDDKIEMIKPYEPSEAERLLAISAEMARCAENIVRFSAEIMRQCTTIARIVSDIKERRGEKDGDDGAGV